MIHSYFVHFQIKGFQLDYLTKASEVKDPVYKHTLTYHLAEYMIENFPEGTDLYSEFGAVARTARVCVFNLKYNKSAKLAFLKLLTL